MRSILPVILFSVLIFSCGEKNSNPVVDHSADSLRKICLHYLDSAAGAGFAGEVIVLRGDSMLVHNGYGFTDSTHKFSVTTSTRIQVASITKTFTALVIMKLAEEKKLSLDDTLKKYFSFVPVSMQNISVRDLLRHASGFRQLYLHDGIEDGDEAAKKIFTDTLAFADCSKFEYSNANYALLGIISEKASGKKWETLVREICFQPAGMQESAFWDGLDQHDSKTVAQKFIQPDTSRVFANWGFKACSGIWSTADDLLKFIRAVESEKIITRSSLDTLQKARYTAKSKNIGIGYGWYSATTSKGNREIFTRGAEGFGHNAVVRYFSEKNCFIIVMSSCGEEWMERGGNRVVSDRMVQLLGL